MKTKLFEIRDRQTCIPAMAILMVEPDSRQGCKILRRAGYDPYGVYPVVVLIKLDSTEAHNNVFEWGSARTMKTAHDYIHCEWDNLSDGDVVDVEFILGESKKKKESEL